MKKIVTSILAATALSAAVSQVQADDSIHFAMEATYPPFEYLGDNNQIEGFDVDLANAICSELKVSCKFSNQPFDSLIPSLKYRKFDAIISGMDITPARMKQVDFSQPYYENSAVFVAAKDRFNTATDLHGKSIGVQNGSTHEQYVIDKLEAQGVKVRPYDSFQNAFLDMSSGRVDAVFADTAVAKEWMAERGQGKFATVGQEVKDANYFGMGYGIAVRKKDELKGQIDNALNTLKANGTYQKIHAKYFAN